MHEVDSAPGPTACHALCLGNIWGRGIRYAEVRELCRWIGRTDGRYDVVRLWRDAYGWRLSAYDRLYACLHVLDGYTRDTDDLLFHTHEFSFAVPVGSSTEPFARLPQNAHLLWPEAVEILDVVSDAYPTWRVCEVIQGGDAILQGYGGHEPTYHVRLMSADGRQHGVGTRDEFMALTQ